MIEPIGKNERRSDKKAPVMNERPKMVLSHDLEMGIGNNYFFKYTIFFMNFF